MLCSADCIESRSACVITLALRLQLRCRLGAAHCCEIILCHFEDKEKGGGILTRCTWCSVHYYLQRSMGKSGPPAPSSAFTSTVEGDIVSLAAQENWISSSTVATALRMGKGVSKKIKDTFPVAYRVDSSTEKGSRAKMGTVSVVDVELEIKAPFSYGTRLSYLTIVNGYTQFGWRPEERGNDAERYLAIRHVFRRVKELYGNDDRHFAFPKVGAGLAGGVWSEIAPIIAEEMAGERCTLVVQQGDEEDEEVYEERPMVVVETATSDRSRCRVTGLKIAKDALRVGVEAFKGARFVRMWALPEPFLLAIRFTNAKSDRGKCKLTAAPFRRGRGKRCAVHKGSDEHLARVHRSRLCASSSVHACIVGVAVAGFVRRIP